MKLRTLSLLLTLGVTACDSEPDYSGVYYEQNPTLDTFKVSFTKKDNGYLFEAGTDDNPNMVRPYIVTIKKGEVYDHGRLRGTFSEDGNTYTATGRRQSVYKKK